MDRSTIEELQMHGQDIPWLLQHWADAKPDHLALIWEPVDGAVETWTYAQLIAATRDLVRPHACAMGGSAVALAITAATTGAAQQGAMVLMVLRPKPTGDVHPAF